LAAEFQTLCPAARLTSMLYLESGLPLTREVPPLGGGGRENGIRNLSPSIRLIVHPGPPPCGLYFS
jgi:hypothetical protein